MDDGRQTTDERYALRFTHHSLAPSPHPLAPVLLDCAVVAGAYIIFLGLCLYQIQLPGLYNDEAFDVIPAMQLLQGHPVELQRNIGLHLFGLDLPLMSSSDYQGVTSTYLVIPFFALGGINVVSLRLMTICVGIVGLVISYFLAQAWFGRGVARLTVLMMAVSPAWVFWSRLGVYVVSQVVPIAGGALLAFTVWVRRNFPARQVSPSHAIPHSAFRIPHSNGPLYLGAFLLGLGLTTKLLFIWFIVALALTALILWGRELWETRRAWLAARARWLWTAVIGALWFALGAAPFFIYNILSGGTFSLLRHTLSAPGATSSGVSNSALLRNLWTEADAFKVLLDGGYFWFQGVAGAVYTNPFTPAFFAMSAIGLVALAIYDHRGRQFELPMVSRVGVTTLVSSLLLALLLAAGLISGNAASLLILAAGALCVAGNVLVIRSALRAGEAWPTSAWLLLLTAIVSGASWWYLGAGRPEGRAPDALLGLWPIDGAGVVFWCCGAGVIVLLGTDKTPSAYQRPTAAALAIIGLIVAQSSVTVSGLWSTHLLVLLPLPQILIAAFAVIAGERVAMQIRATRRSTVATWARPAAALLIVGLVILFDLRVVRDYHRDLAVTGGSSTFSDAIYSLASYLDDQSPRQHIVALDWGFKRPVQLLTLDRVNPDDAFGYEEPPTEATKQAIATLVKEQNTLFLFHTKQAGVAYPRFDVFAAAARDTGKQPVLERTFFQRDGTPVYQVYSVR